MKFANAYKGLKLITIAEMLNISSMIVYIVSMGMLIAMGGNGIDILNYK